MAGSADGERREAKPSGKVKHVIYLHMSGAPPQLDLFDYKPTLNKHHLQPCPEEYIKNERFAFIKGRPKLLGSPYKFAQHGKSGAWVSELLPNIAKLTDELCFVKSMWTDQFNHAPAELFLFTGTPRFDGAAMGSWITWGLGSGNQNLPGFVVLDLRRHRSDGRQSALEQRLSCLPSSRACNAAPRASRSSISTTRRD